VNDIDQRYKEFGHYLQKAARLANRAGDGFMLAHCGLTMTQYLLLQSFADATTQPSQQTLVQYTGMSKSALSRQISTAVAQGWLERNVSGRFKKYAGVWKRT
jgi:DNA-binding MarR family transcriptional regulator